MYFLRHVSCGFVDCNLPWHGGGIAEVPNKVTNGERPLDQLLDTSGREEPKPVDLPDPMLLGARSAGAGERLTPVPAGAPDPNSRPFSQISVLELRGIVSKGATSAQLTDGGGSFRWRKAWLKPAVTRVHVCWLLVAARLLAAF